MLPVLSALLYILIFPKFNLSWLAWIALAPLARYALRATPRSAFAVGWGCGTVAYIGILYWLLTTFHVAQQSMVLAIFCLTGLALLQGFSWGLWSWMLSGGRDFPYWSIYGACAWIALDYLTTTFFPAFPWTLLGTSQWSHLIVIQIARVTGVYGISFLIVLVNLVLVDFFRRSHEEADGSKALMVVFTAILLAGALLYGRWIQDHYREEPAARPLRVALLQGNIDQYKKWDQAYVQEIEDTYTVLALQAARDKPDLIVWPETAFPGYFSSDAQGRLWLDHLVRRTGTSHIVGVPTMGPDGRAFNAAVSLNAQGDTVSEYDKTHLVPFGETVPLPDFFGRWIGVINELGGFYAGDRVVPVLAAGIPVGVSICFEAIFPNLVRQFVRQQAEVLANLTNDGWYMRTAAPYQHFISNVIRAVENDRWVMRADNTGISALINPLGRVEKASSIFESAIIEGTVYPRRALTFYTRYGDVFAWICTVFCILFWIRAILRRS